MIIQNMIQLTKNLTPIEAEISTYVLYHKERVLELSIQELSDEIYVSKSAIHRFCKKIGLKGFNELKVNLAKDLAKQLENEEQIDVNYPFNENDGQQQIADKLLSLYDAAIRDTHGYIDPIELQKIASLLFYAKTIDIYTHSHNMAIAENFQDQMLTIGRAVDCPKSFYKQRLTALASDKTHVALILSYSGKATFIKPIVESLNKKKVVTVLVGKAGSKAYAPCIKHALYISGKEDLRNRISQFSSHISMQYMMDVLFACIYNMNRDENIRYLKNSIYFMDDRDVDIEE